METWRKTNITKGVYMSASKIFQEEGGQESDLAPTRRLLTKCAKLGYPFVIWNEMMERTDVLYFRRGSREEFQKAWSLYVTHVDSGTCGSGPTATSVASTPATPVAAAEQPEVPLTPSSKRQRAAAAQGSPEGAGADQMQPKHVFAAARKTSRNLGNTVSSANALLKQISVETPRGSFHDTQTKIQ